MERREEDRLRALLGGMPDAAPAVAGLPDVAFGWLHEVLRTEFGGGIADFTTVAHESTALPAEGRALAARRGAAPAGMAAASHATGGAAPGDARWRREWERRWRQLRLPDRLSAYHEELGRARTPEQVYTALTEHAVRIVDGYTCVLFPPGTGAERLRPVPNPRLRSDAARLSLPASPPLPRAERIAVTDTAPEAPFAGLAALFAEERAASLAHASFGEDGAVFLIERRQGRIFEAEDWNLLRTLAAQAEAALERVRLLGGIDVLAHSDPETGLAGAAHGPAALAHAWEMAERGEPLSIVLLQFSPSGADTRPDTDGRAAAVRLFAACLRDEAGEHGLALRHAEDRFLLILPRTDEATAHALVGRVRLRAGGSAPAVVVAHQADTPAPAPAALIERAIALLDAMTAAGA